MDSEEISSGVSCNSQMHQEFAPPICKCGVNASLTTSWSTNNPGRRFYGCGRYSSGRNCKFFEWYDVDAPIRYKKVIKGLLKSVDREKVKCRRMSIIFMVVVSLLVVGFLYYVRRM